MLFGSGEKDGDMRSRLSLGSPRSRLEDKDLSASSFEGR